MQVAILDDYQNVALTMADWSEVAAHADITGDLPAAKHWQR